MIILSKFRWCSITSRSWILSAFSLNLFKFWYSLCMIKYSFSSSNMIWNYISSNFWQRWNIFIVSWTWSNTGNSIKSIWFWVWITYCWKFITIFWININLRILILPRTRIFILWFYRLTFIYYFCFRSQRIWRWSRYLIFVCIIFIWWRYWYQLFV